MVRLRLRRKQRLTRDLLPPTHRQRPLEALGRQRHHLQRTHRKRHGCREWFSYVFINAETNEQQTKQAWFVRHDGLVFAFGYYEYLHMEQAAKWLSLLANAFFHRAQTNPNAALRVNSRPP